MATMNTNEVGVGAAKATGAIWIAPKDTTLPTDATTALASAFKLFGFTSDAGVTLSESSSTNSLRAWEGRAEVFNVQTEYTEQVSFAPIQINADVAKLTWGDDAVTADGSGNLHIKHHGGTLEPIVIVIETTPRTGIVKRYTGNAQLTERGESTMDGTQFDGRQLTFNMLADSNGVTMHEYVAYVTGSTS